MAAARFRCRRATIEDADGIAAVFSPSFRLLTFLPMLHTTEDDRRFIEDVILKTCEVTVAEDDSGIVSFLARADEEIRLLYTRPASIGAGAGPSLLDAARRFYEAHGFRAIRFTDGAGNEEKMPDVRYRWQRT